MDDLRGEGGWNEGDGTRRAVCEADRIEGEVVDSHDCFRVFMTPTISNRMTRTCLVVIRLDCWRMNCVDRRSSKMEGDWGLSSGRASV